MNIKKNFLPAFALGAIVFTFSIAAFGQTEQMRTHFSRYGMHYVSGGQTARVTVQNPSVSDSEIIPCIRVRVIFDLYEAAGDGSVRLRFARRVTREVELDGGEAATFDLAASRNGEWISPAVVAGCEENCPSDPSRASVLTTVAVRQGGNTILLLPAVQKGFDPQPDPPAARPQ